jgi:hypothetical protein
MIRPGDSRPRDYSGMTSAAADVTARGGDPATNGRIRHGEAAQPLVS